MNTTTGAEVEMEWWGDQLLVNDVSSTPQPQIEFLTDAGAGTAGQCNVEYTTLTGLGYTRWYRDTPQSLGDFEVRVEIVSDTSPSTIVIKDRLDATKNEYDEFELIGAKVYLDFTGASVGTEITAEVNVIAMNTNDAWREVLRRVTLYGKKTA